jgi:hypothetical protein
MKRILRPLLCLAAAAPVWAPSALAVADSPVNTVPADQVLGDVGDITLSGNDGKVVTSGDGTTEFFVELPDGATCPGDSANDQWRISTFLIPVGDDPLDILFGSTGPEPPWSGSYPLFDHQGLPMSFKMLRRNDSAGEPGLVEQLDPSSFRMIAENQVVAGRYRMGVACSYFTQTTQYWDAEIDISAAPSNVDPAGLTWSMPNVVAPVADSESGSSSTALVIGAIAAAVLAALFFMFRRTNSSRTSKDPR